MRVEQEQECLSPYDGQHIMRRIYRAEGIQIDLWPHRFKGIRGAYLNDSVGITVMIAKDLPPEPMIFTLAHELKHHLKDRAVANALCSSENEKDAIEIGAEVFAAELIYPEADFAAAMRMLEVHDGGCTAEHLVRLKHDTETTLSYMALAKRAEFLNFAVPGSFAKVKWTKIAESLYGEPVYKRIQRYRNPQSRSVI